MDMTVVEMIDKYTYWLREYKKGILGVKELASIKGYLTMLEAEFDNARKPKITFGEFVNALNKKLGTSPKYASIFVSNSTGGDYTEANLKRKENALVQYVIKYDDKKVMFIVDQPIDTTNAKFLKQDYTTYTYATVTGDNVAKFSMQLPLRQIAELGAVGNVYTQILADKTMKENIKTPK